ncbi:lipocalin family protein [Gemmatimonadota bacterium]
MRPRLIVLALVAVLTACGGSSTEPEPIWGTYNLTTIAGQPLPYVLIQVGADMLEVTAGHMRLNSDHTFSTALTLRLTEDGVEDTETGTNSGTFTVSGSSLTFTDSDGETFTGSLTDKTLTLIEDGDAFVFVKP